MNQTVRHKTASAMAGARGIARHDTVYNPLRFEHLDFAVDFHAGQFRGDSGYPLR